MDTTYQVITNFYLAVLYFTELVDEIHIVLPGRQLTNLHWYMSQQLYTWNCPKFALLSKWTIKYYTGLWGTVFINVVNVMAVNELPHTLQRALFWGLFIVLAAIVLLAISCCCYCCSICCFCLGQRGDVAKSKRSKCTCGIFLLLAAISCLWANV